MQVCVFPLCCHRSLCCRILCLSSTLQPSNHSFKLHVYCLQLKSSHTPSRRITKHEAIMFLKHMLNKHASTHQAHQPHTRSAARRLTNTFILAKTLKIVLAAVATVERRWILPRTTCAGARFFTIQKKLAWIANLQIGKTH